MTDHATITGVPSEAAANAAAAAFRDAPEDAQAPWRTALAAAYAVDEQRIRTDQTRQIVEYLFKTVFLDDECDPGGLCARAVARKFGAST